MSNIITLVGAGRTFLSTNDLFIQANTNDSGQVEIVLPNTKLIFGNSNSNTAFNYVGIRFTDIGNNASVNNIVIYAFDDDLINGQQTLTINTNGSGGLINLIGEGEWIFDANSSSTGGSSIIQEGSGLNSSQRINSGNTSSGAYSTALGFTNQSKGCSSSVLGGGFNTAGGQFSSVINGGSNTASGVYSSILNGYDNSTISVNGQILKFSFQSLGSLPDGSYDKVSPSSQTGIGTGALFSFDIFSNKIKIQVTNGGENYQLQDILTFNGTIFGGTSPSDDILITITAILDATSDYSTILNGRNNNTSACLSSVMNGKCNSASAIYSSVSNGYQNSAEGQYSSVSNGYSNSATAIYSSVSNGYGNTADGQYSCCGCICGGYSSVSNGYKNRAGGQFSSVINGNVNLASGNFSTITNGRCNTASGYASFIAGGLNNNTCSQCKSFIVGSDISADRVCATFVNNLSIKDIPTSSAGLPSGSVWNNGGVLNIVA